MRGQRTCERERRPSGGRAAAFALVASLSAAAAPLPAAGQPRNVLILDAGAPGRPLGVQFTSGFRDTLVTTFPEPVATYYEGIDLERFPDPAYLTGLRAFFGEKYRRHPPAVIAVVGDSAVPVALDLRREHWPEASIVFSVTRDDAARTAVQAGAATGLTAHLDPWGTLGVAFRLFPDTDEIVLLGPAEMYRQPVEQLVKDRGPSLRVTRLHGLPFDELLRRVSTLRPTAIIFYSDFTLDSRGQGFFGREALDRVAAVANRPIFSHFGTYLGHGIVGGSLLDAGIVAREAAALVARVLAGTPAGEIPVTVSQSNRLQFDARQLERWALDTSRLPAGSDVRFRTPSLLEEYRGSIIATAVVVAVQAALILALVSEVRRRRNAQAQSRRLSARVLTAQEEERSRIARELHDDVNQRLALFALRLDHLGSAPGVAEAQRAEALRLVEQARTLSSDVHRMAHELHPAILDQLGLVPALQRVSGDLASSDQLLVDVECAGWPRDVPRDVELAFYRVAQEALHNVARHSGAKEARVVLVAQGTELSLRVIDRGRGFDLSLSRGAQLGLAGMTERLRLVGGRLDVQSAPGRGTTVAATVPRPSAEGGSHEETAAPAR